MWGTMHTTDPIWKKRCPFQTGTYTPCPPVRRTGKGSAEDPKAPTGKTLPEDPKAPTGKPAIEDAAAPLGIHVQASRRGYRGSDR